MYARILFNHALYFNIPHAFLITLGVTLTINDSLFKYDDNIDPCVGSFDRD